jgi:transcriptional regulator with XRE-family HTH domain
MAAPDSKRLIWAIRSSADLGRTLSAVRRQRGITQEQLAETTGMRRDYLSQLESGTGTLELQRLVLALRRLGADITVSVEASEDGS